MIDITFLTKMMGGDEKLAQKFVGIFKAQAPQQMLELKSQFESKDWDSMANTAHSLKSQFNYLNLRSLAEQMARIEQLAEDNKHEGIEKLLEDVEAEFSGLFETSSLASDGA